MRGCRLRLLVWLVVMLLGGCAAQGGPSAAEPAAARSGNEVADPERRARVRLELASAYFGRGQATTALEELKQVLALKPDLPEAYNLRGLVYASLGEPKLAEESYQRSLQLKPRDGDTLHNYAWFLCQNSRHDEAQRQFEAALTAPQYFAVPRTLLVQGVCLARAGKWLEAERALARSFELEPSNPATAFSLSEVLFRRGEYERARFYVRRINSQPDQSNAQSLWLAARIERRAGNLHGADDYGRQLRERYPDSPEALRLARGQFDE